MLTFIDVSGDPYSAPNKSPWISAAAICLRKRCLDNINQSVYRLKRDILGNDTIELKATDLVNQSTLMNPQLKARYLDRLFIECINHGDCFCSAIVFENCGANKKSSENRLPKHYIDLLWRIEAICRFLRIPDTVVILDNESRKIDKSLAFGFGNYMYRTSGASELERIVPVPIFADSEMTTGLQLADIVSGVLRKYCSLGLNLKTDQTNQYHRMLSEYQKIIMTRSINKLRVGRHCINSLYIPNQPYIL